MALLRMCLFGALLSGVALQPLDAQGTSKVDLTGKWAFTVTTDNGVGRPTVTLKQQGDSITGHYSSQLLGERDLTGKVKGDTVTFSFPAEAQGAAFRVMYIATMDGPNAMKGSVDFGGYGGGTFTAKRE